MIVALILSRLPDFSRLSFFLLPIEIIDCIAIFEVNRSSMR